MIYSRGLFLLNRHTNTDCHRSTVASSSRNLKTIGFVEKKTKKAKGKRKDRRSERSDEGKKAASSRVAAEGLGGRRCGGLLESLPIHSHGLKTEDWRRWVRSRPRNDDDPLKVPGGSSSVEIKLGSGRGEEEEEAKGSDSTLCPHLSKTKTTKKMPHLFNRPCKVLTSVCLERKK